MGRGSATDIPGQGASSRGASWQAAQLSSTLGLRRLTHAFLLPPPRNSRRALGVPAFLFTSSSPSLVGSSILGGSAQEEERQLPAELGAWPEARGCCLERLHTDCLATQGQPGP